mgnify:CR=1 FL=1
MASIMGECSVYLYCHLIFLFSQRETRDRLNRKFENLRAKGYGTRRDAEKPYI